jgi:hypothetical protein
VSDDEPMRRVRDALIANLTPERADLAFTVRALAARLHDQYAGRTIEVRIPPFSAVQLRSLAGDGPRHTRGTPPNVVEMNPETFVRLSFGVLTWDDAFASHALSVSGAHAADVATMLLAQETTRPLPARELQ